MKGEVIYETETITSPETVFGRDYRVPTITRSYDDYQLEDLHLPPNWQEAIPRMTKPEVSGFSILLQGILKGKDYGWELGVDRPTGLVTRLSLTKDHEVSSVVLDPAEFTVSEAKYEGKGISSLWTAMVYQEFFARYLSFMTDFKQNYAFPLCLGYGHGGSVDLVVPARFLNKKRAGIADEYNQNRFTLKAANIAGQFGLTARFPLAFDENGILKYFMVEEGNACDYGLVSCSLGGEYAPHNVDNPWQAAALHGIGAAFINELLEKEEYQKAEVEERREAKKSRRRVKL